MKTFNLEKGMPTVSDAGKPLAKIIRESKSNQKVIKIIHGAFSCYIWNGLIKIRPQRGRYWVKPKGHSLTVYVRARARARERNRDRTRNIAIVGLLKNEPV